MASLNPSEPAILKLISDESTEWYLPSNTVTLTSTTGIAEHAALLHRLVHALLDRGDELPRDRAADDLVLELEARRRARAASTRTNATPNCPCPPVCFLYLPSASASPVIVSRYATFTSSVSTSTPSLRCSRSSAIPRWVSPMPHRSVWWVSALRSRRRAGSSSSSRCSALASLSSSPFDLARIACASTGSGAVNGSTDERRRRARRARRRWSCR